MEKGHDEILPQLAMTYNNIGLVYRGLDMFEKADDAYKRALRIQKKLIKKSPDAYLPDIAMTYNNIGALYYLKAPAEFRKSERGFRKALKIRKQLAKKSPDTYFPIVLETKLNIGSLCIKSGKLPEGIAIFQEVSEHKHLHKSLRYDLSAGCFEGLGEAYIGFHKQREGAENYLLASANWFLWFKSGVNWCVKKVFECLEQVIEHGQGEINGDAIMIRTALRASLGEKTPVLKVPLSKRGKALKKALNGNRVELESENEIDQMVISLMEDLLLKQKACTDENR